MAGLKRILIAEDDYAISLALKTIVGANIECELVMARDGGEAWEHLQRQTFDLIVSDWNMPVKTGAQLLQEMQGDSRLATIPFIMLTARADKDSVVQAVQTGVTDYVHKPFNRATLLEKIRTRLDDDPSQAAIATARKPRKVVEEITAKLKQDAFVFPTMSNLASQVREAIENHDADLEDIARIIRDDPLISARLIALANTAMYRGTKKVILLEKAIKRLGLQETVNYLWLFSNAGLFASEQHIFNDMLQQLRKHALATAACARLIAKRLGWANSEDVFFMGLLHDIGHILILQIVEEIAKQEPIEDESTVQAAIDQLHEQFGALLLARWGFPDEMQHIALYHDRLAEAPQLTPELLLVHVASRLTHRIGFGLKGDDGAKLCDMRFADRLGLAEEDLPEILAGVQTYLGESTVLG